MTDFRARFDAEVAFLNGGDLRVSDFRLDLPSADVSESELAELFVRHLGLALVQRVDITELSIVEEQHKGSRGTDGAVPTERRIIDLSHTVSAGLVTYPGLPAPVITPHLTREDSRAKYAPGTEFAMDVITMIGNTGTYLDSPFHRYAGGTDLAGLELSTLVGLRAEVFHLADVSWRTDAATRGIPASVFHDRDLAGSAVLLHTGWDVHFGRPAYAIGAPFLTEAGVQHLVDAGVTLVGIDSLNIDDTESGGERPAHSLLLDAGIHVVEHLTNLGAVPARGARFTAVPPKVADFGTFPVRAFAELG
ncbi:MULTISPECIES: cyclase family protein [unclassified Leifsonia]|uniref:cyclase family protein n=1 Tax=unclassified Leifsonia TaxID=2663824 RepID=UPI0006F247BC|nr:MULTISPECIES: cyclase family protein [unclassified Leifsonia]KQX05503.1 cyclase [Leifsonia sp. Root1293]KRA09136.1 cyclase [Leifsonia sp. Root60]